MNKLLRSLEAHASWRKVLFLFLGSMLLATCIITQFFGLLELDPEAMMDSSDYYDSVRFYEFLEQQGPIGRHSYLLLHLIDYVFIVSFGLLLVFTLYSLLRNAFKSDKMKYLSFVPLISSASDLLENLSVDISILVFPRKIAILANLSGYFTVTKMNVLYVSFMLILILLLAVIVKTIITRCGKDHMK